MASVTAPPIGPITSARWISRNAISHGMVAANPHSTDPTRKIAGVLMTQTLPFADPTVLQALDSFESAVYQSVD